MKLFRITRPTSAELAIVIGLAAIDATANRFAINPDGISYLNLSDYYREWDFAGAANAYWSPLYPWILGLSNWLLRTNISFEIVLAHAVNACLFVLCYFSWRFFLSELRVGHGADPGRGGGGISRKPAERTIRLTAFTLFLWCCFAQIGLALITPDLLVASFAFTAAGLLHRIYRTNPTDSLVVIFGLTLAVGYYSKAVMFPAALVFLALALYRLVHLLHAYRLSVLLVVCFIVASIPQVIVTSVRSGKLTYAETGRLSYGIMVNGHGYLWPEQQAIERLDVMHPVTVIHSNPNAFSFPLPIKHSSYPLWDAPAYWAQGFHLWFDRGTQMRVTLSILLFYLRLTGALAAAIAVLALLARFKPIKSVSPVVLIGFAIVAAYALVYAEERLVAPWFLLIFLPMMVSFAPNPVLLRNRIAAVVLVTLTVILASSVARKLFVDISSLAASTADDYEDPNASAAAGLARFGVKRGDRVAYIGNSFYAYWARLAGVQISMEVPDSEAKAYWSSDEAGRMAVNQAFIQHGASLIIGAPTAPCSTYRGWQAVPHSGLCVFLSPSHDERN